MKKYYPYLIVLVLIITGLNSCTSKTNPTPDVKPFHLSSVHLLESPFQHAAKMNKQYVMSHDPNRLLAPFLIDAGLKPKGKRYGNWESSGLDGHTCGHYLSSLSMMIASMESKEAKERLNYMIDELARCQETNGNGYIGGIPGGQQIWKEIAKGNIDAGNFSLNGKWVPLYNIHKLFAGLRDAWLYADNEKARDILIKLSDWFVKLCSNLSDEQIQEMLVSEHGGMNEVFADVYDITGEKKYLDLAVKLSHREILNPLLNRKDKLTGLHANTQIPKVIGYMRIGQLKKDTAWIEASDFFWKTVVKNRTISIGGNSTHEHFHPVDDFSSMVESRQGPETCNSYNMLRLSKQLYLHKDNLKYIDYYERTLYNHILSSQHPGHGGLVYFTPMRPRHYRVYSNPEKTFWCCVGSGMENHTKYGEMVYAHDGDNVYINLFIPSELNWEEKGIKLIQKTDFPASELSSLSLHLDKPGRFTVGIRYPQWLTPGEMKVKVNGKTIKSNAQPGEYFQVSRKWEDGDKIKVHLPMHTYGEYLPDEMPFMSLLHGPLVLSAATDSSNLEGLIADDSRMGHVASGPLYPRQKAPMLQVNNKNWSEKVVPVDGKPLTFKAPELIVPDQFDQLELIPFYRMHDARYMVYWRTGSKEEIDSVRESLRRQEEEKMALETRTIDQVATGEQQPESEHNFKGEGTETGVHKNRHWRHATNWFSYDLKDPDKEAHTLRITYFGADSGRTFDILINGQHLTNVTLDGSGGDQFVNRDYPFSDILQKTKKDSIITVKFEAKEGSVAGGIYHIRLLRKKQ